MDKEFVLGLLESKKTPALVHGTCVEAVMQLLSKGRLPSSLYNGCLDHPAFNGYLFFTPRKKSFENHPLYEKIKVDWDARVERDAKSYAKHIQQRVYLKGLFGDWPWDVDPTEFGLARSRVPGFDKLKEPELASLKRSLDRLRGVVIGLDGKALELRLEDGCDEPGYEVMAYLPEGLDIKYVSYISPKGRWERDRLYKLVNSI